MEEGLKECLLHLTPVVLGPSMSPVSAHFWLSSGQNYTTRIYGLAGNLYSRKVAVWGWGERRCDKLVTAFHHLAGLSPSFRVAIVSL